jgi:hypothetical protein
MMINMAGYVAKAIKPTAFNKLTQAEQEHALTPTPAGAPAPPPAWLVGVLTWLVALACLAFSAIGTMSSFFVAGSTITTYRLWGLSFIIGVFLIGLSYAQKYSIEASRMSFTPVDAFNYLTQGFLWPATWPSFANAIGFSSTITAPSPPAAGKGAYNSFGMLMSLFS